jgi:hypothetical protein
MLGLLGYRLGLRPRKRVNLDPMSIALPDSAVAREAEELCAGQRPEMLVNHCYRTFLWATALAEYGGLTPDPELLYVSSLLHDLGLSEGAGSDSAPPCFTLVGAGAAVLIGRRGGWDEARAERAEQAITMHMNLRVGPEHGVEAYLMTAGTQLDVLGHRVWRLSPETVRAVLERYPRRGVKRGMVELFGEQARAHPGSRARFYRYLGQSPMFRAAPFRE